MTAGEILNEGTALLSSRHIDTPALDAGLLLVEVLHTDKAGLIINRGAVVTEEDARAYRRLLERRLGGECTAYILGRKEFRGLEFTVTPDVLVPRPDTETLVEAVLELTGQEKNTRPRGLGILDLCTGSGAVAIALKNERPCLEVWASDISKKALAAAKANAEKLLGSAGAVHFVESDLFEGFRAGAVFDLIAANPPYIARAEIETLSAEVRGEPRLALDGGGDGLDIIRRITAGAGAFLAPGGCLLMEADPRQMQAIAGLLTGAGWTGIRIWKDLAGRERVIGGQSGGAG
jgi:release factor glutamine methyltransferase